MSEMKRIVDQMTRIWSGDAWHGDAIQKLLATVTADEAASRPMGSAHSIWEIALHMTTWEDVVRRRIEGMEVETVADSQDWPAIGSGTWEGTRAKLIDTNLRLRESMSTLPDELLEEEPTGSQMTRSSMLLGIIHHDLYHSGQIAILRRGLVT